MIIWSLILARFFGSINKKIARKLTKNKCFVLEIYGGTFRDQKSNVRILQQPKYDGNWNI